MKWRVLIDPPMAGLENMARDHALAEELEAGHAVLRLYRWDRPTVSLGRNEPGKCYDTDRARECGIPFVRRPTGGRAVLHSDELTYAVVAPLRALGGLRQPVVAYGLQAHFARVYPVHVGGDLIHDGGVMAGADDGAVILPQRFEQLGAG